MATQSVHVAVLGAGPGGYAAAFYAADLGMHVALVDEGKNPGGVCLYRGCIPSKALLHVAKVIDEARHALRGRSQPRAASSVRSTPPRTVRAAGTPRWLFRRAFSRGQAIGVGLTSTRIRATATSIQLPLGAAGD